MHRRTFLKSTLAASAVPFAARGASPAGIKLGFDTYSLRAFRWKALEFLDYAASQKLDAVQISSLDDFESLEPAYLSQVNEKAKRLGIQIDGGTGCICSASKSWGKKAGTPREEVLRGLRASKAVGATSMRCFMGSDQDRRTSDNSLQRCMDETIQVFQSVKNEARDLQVKIALENHAGDMQAREVLTIIQESGPDFVGACLDTGNPMWVMENPLVTMEVLGPHVLTTHVRDSAVFETAQGAAAQWVAMGDGNVDLAGIVTMQRKLCPQAAMHLEIITGRPPRMLPYFDPHFWKWFEKTPASEFVRFVDLARKGHPFYGVMVIEDADSARKLPEFAAALKEQQRVDLERSFDFAKHSLGVGVKWQA